jgi:hypothetical protein
MQIFAVERLPDISNGHWLFDTQTGRIAVYPESGSPIGGWVEYGGAFQSTTTSSVLSVGNWVIYEWDLNSSTGIGTFFVNGVSEGTATYSAIATGGVTAVGESEDGAQGSSSTPTGVGDLAEFALYSTVLGTSDSNSVGAALASKYGITTSYSASLTGGMISASSSTSTSITPEETEISGGTAPYSTVFSYSTSTNGTYTQIGTAVAGSAPVANAAATGLSPNTTYYFRAVTTDSEGTPATVTEPSSSTGTPLTTPFAPATAYTSAESASTGVLGTPVTITFTGNGETTALITPSVSGVSGTFSPTTVALSNETGVTVTFTPSSVGTATFSSTNGGGLTNPSNLTYTVSEPAATSYSSSESATSGVTGSPVTITYVANGTSTATITPSVSGVSGVFSPTTISLNGENNVTVTFTPSTTGTASLTSTNSGSLTNPSALSYSVSSSSATAYSSSLSSASGTVGTPVTITFTGNGPSTATITPSVSGVSGTFSPTTVNLNGTTGVTVTFTPSATGTATINSTNSGSLSNPSSLTYTVNTSGTIAPNNSAFVYSPYNWLVTGSYAKSINPGAYWRIQVDNTTTCAIGLNLGAGTPYSECWARVDAGSWQEYVPSASGAQTWSLTMPSASVDTSLDHLIEFVFKSETETTDRWNSQSTALEFTGLTLDSGATVTAAVRRKYTILLYGTSISEGIRKNGYTGIGSDTDRNDALQDYSYNIGRSLNAEIGVVAFGAQGINTGGSGNVPSVANSYNYLWSGQARSFSPVPDMVLFEEGANDGSNNISAGIASIINGIGTIGTTTNAGLNGTQFVLLEPFGAQDASNVQLAATSFGNANVNYVSTAGFWNTADSSDGIHPYGYADLNGILPDVTSAIGHYLVSPSGSTHLSHQLSRGR